MISEKTTGMDELLRMVDSLSEAPRIRAGCAAQGYHTPSTKDGKPVANATIWNSQAKAGRAAAFLSSAEDTAGTGKAVEMANAWTERKPETVLAKARELADIMVAAVRAHVAAGQSKDGPMKPLTERYKAMKKHVWKAGGKPILERTGELLSSLVASFTVRGGRR